MGLYKVTQLSKSGDYKVKWWFCMRPYNHHPLLKIKNTGGVVIRSCTKPALDLIITRLRVILKILWPYKDPFAALKKWPLDLINTHLRSSKKKSDLITAQMRKKTFCKNRFFPTKKIWSHFSGQKKEWPYNRANAEEDLLHKWVFRPKKVNPFTRPRFWRKLLSRIFERKFSLVLILTVWEPVFR